MLDTRETKTVEILDSSPPQKEIQKKLNHRNMSQTEKYIKPFSENEEGSWLDEISQVQCSKEEGYQDSTIQIPEQHYRARPSIH